MKKAQKQKKNYKKELFEFCTSCNGTGFIDDKYCLACDGTGSRSMLNYSSSTPGEINYKKEYGFEQKEQWVTDTKNETHSTCPNMRPVSIITPPIVFQIFKKICEVKKTEWQIFLRGEEINDKYYLDGGYYIPRQGSTYSSVINHECINAQFIKDNKLIAAVHSHADMDVFFSGTDKEMTMNNEKIPVYIVVNNAGKHLAQVIKKMPCGHMAELKADMVLQDQNIDIPDIDKISVVSWHAWNRKGGIKCQDLSIIL